MPDDQSRLGLPGRATLAVLSGLFLGTLAMRPQLVGIGPLLPQIQADLGVSFGVVGLLTTIPVLLMGLFAPIGPWVSGRIGPRNAIALCMLGIVAFGLLRPALPGVAAILLTTVAIGVGMGTAGAVLPIVVKLRASGEPARATGAYAAGIVAGSLVAAAAAIPLANALGGWRATLVVFAFAGLVSLACWLAFIRPDPPEDRATGRPPSLPWRSRTAWMLVAVFATQSLLYYSAVSWLPAVYVERGWSEADAGNLVAVLHAVGLATGIALPFFADRVGTRRTQLVSVAAVTMVGYLGIVLLPDLAVLWAAVMGVGLGAVFPLVLTLPVDVADSPSAVGATAAFMLLGGYVLSSIGPVGLGILRDLTGNYQTSLWLLVALSVALMAVSVHPDTGTPASGGAQPAGRGGLTPGQCSAVPAAIGTRSVASVVGVRAPRHARRGAPRRNPDLVLRRAAVVAPAASRESTLLSPLRPRSIVRCRSFRTAFARLASWARRPLPSTGSSRNRPSAPATSPIVMPPNNNDERAWARPRS